MSDMEKRCPFCYSNMIEYDMLTYDRKAKYQCNKCFNEFDEDYVLYAPKRRRVLNDEGIG